MKGSISSFTSYGHSFAFLFLNKNEFSGLKSLIFVIFYFLKTLFLRNFKSSFGSLSQISLSFSSVFFFLFSAANFDFSIFLALIFKYSSAAIFNSSSKSSKNHFVGKQKSLKKLHSSLSITATESVFSKNSPTK